MKRYGAFKSFDRFEQRFLFPFNDVSSDLIETEQSLGAGWSIKPIQYKELRRYGVEEHFDAYRLQTIGDTLPSQGYERADDGSVLKPFNHQKDWRFLMIEGNARKVGIGPWSMTQALYISDLELLVGAASDGTKNPQVMQNWRGFTGRGERIPLSRSSGPSGRAQLTGNAFSVRMDAHKLPSKAGLENAQKVVEWRRSKLDDHIKLKIYDFMNLDRLPDFSLHKHLGHFSILESLLSHKPERTDPIDSIQRQLERNIRLIEYELSKEKIGLFDDEFSGVKIRTVVSKLYGYRSSIAHGDGVQSSLEKINSIRPGKTKTDHLWVMELIRKLTRRTLQLGVKDPHFFEVLK